MNERDILKLAFAIASFEAAFFSLKSLIVMPVLFLYTEAKKSKKGFVLSARSQTFHAHTQTHLFVYKL